MGRDRVRLGATFRPTPLDEQRVTECTAPDHEPGCRVHVQHFLVSMAIGGSDPTPDRFHPDGVTRVEVHR